MTPQSQEKQFIFVGGPMLSREKGLPARSQLTQQIRRETLLQRRSKAAAELEKLMKDRTSAKCTCHARITVASDSRLIEGWRPIEPKAPESGVPLESGPIPRRTCASCGGYLHLPDRIATSRGPVRDLLAGSYDPMIPVNRTTSQLRVHELLSFANIFIFPNLRPLDYTARLYQSWVFPFDDELRLYALLWAVTYQRDALRLTSGCLEKGSKEQFWLKGLTLKSLQKEVGTYSGAKPIDSIIMCILFLAVNDALNVQIHRDASPFTPMFTDLHGLGIYGSRDYNMSHWKIIQVLLETFGGIQILRVFALAWHISLSDVTNAAHSLQKPVYPMLGVDGRDLELDPPLKLFTRFDKRISQGKVPPGYTELLFLVPPVHQEHVRVFSHIGELSHVLSHFSVNPCSPNALDLLGDCRNLVHHRLFSLPDENDPTEQALQLPRSKLSAEGIEQSKDIYLTCRLATLLYATHVTFPIPRSTVTRGPLLDSLCPKLQLLADQGVSSPLLLWCTCVALIALKKGASSDKTMLIFRDLCRSLEVTRVDQLLQLLRSFAWVDIAVKHHYRDFEGYLA